LEEVRKSGDLPVPLHLRNAPTKLMKDLGYGRDYQYAHDYNNNFVEQECMPEHLTGKAFYKPGQNAREKELKQFLDSRWKDKYRF
jgi:putative ATPase